MLMTNMGRSDAAYLQKRQDLWQRKGILGWVEEFCDGIPIENEPEKILDGLRVKHRPSSRLEKKCSNYFAFLFDLPTIILSGSLLEDEYNWMNRMNED